MHLKLCEHSISAKRSASDEVKEHLATIGAEPPKQFIQQFELLPLIQIKGLGLERQQDPLQAESGLQDRETGDAGGSSVKARRAL